MPSKSSHSPRSARRKSARKRADANRTRRASAPPKPAAPAKPAEPQNGAEVRPPMLARAEESLTVKREVERYPIARRFHDCPRCANHHEALEVKTLTRATDGFTHFAMCPNLGEPILLTVAGA